ncbi:MAG: AtpZ/AtpI family protein [Candidatus Omnitrophica bacterium]|nr:AtpZ/AtpI family protein [Candidatus Omnitrophota bacterium]MDD5236859.1 AtpZ/AtpI family protein [Candidatus Omnitrophota bacterium]MDD5610657.1 AtpZ/AtpI family protein [Candidatus Omnitrophota bacterium]
MTKKKEFYKRIKIFGLASFIPFTLVSGPIAGYFAGDYLEKTLHLKFQLTLILILLGLVASLFETMKIIRAMIKMEKDLK